MYDCNYEPATFQTQAQLTKVKTKIHP